jgi:hypothetical protein
VKLALAVIVKVPFTEAVLSTVTFPLVSTVATEVLLRWRSGGLQLKDLTGREGA